MEQGKARHGACKAKTRHDSPLGLHFMCTKAFITWHCSQIVHWPGFTTGHNNPSHEAVTLEGFAITLRLSAIRTRCPWLRGPPWRVRGVSGRDCLQTSRTTTVAVLGRKVPAYLGCLPRCSTHGCTCSSVCVELAAWRRRAPEVGFKRIICVGSFPDGRCEVESYFLSKPQPRAKSLNLGSFYLGDG